MIGEPDRDPFTEAALRHFEEAAEYGFPAFGGDIAQSSPLNASPWLGPYRDFLVKAAKRPGRAALVRAMDEVRSQASCCGIAIDAVLIGGSFVGLASPAPRDLDCLMFYRQARPRETVDAARLAGLQRHAKGRGVDARFVPVDGDPLLLIKSVGYFARLFAMTKGSDKAAPHGLILLDCRD